MTQTNDFLHYFFLQWQKHCFLYIVLRICKEMYKLRHLTLKLDIGKTDIHELCNFMIMFLSMTFKMIWWKSLWTNFLLINAWGDGNRSFPMGKPNGWFQLVNPQKSLQWNPTIMQSTGSIVETAVKWSALQQNMALIQVKVKQTPQSNYSGHCHMLFRIWNSHLYVELHMH